MKTYKVIDDFESEEEKFKFEIFPHAVKLLLPHLLKHVYYYYYIYFLLYRMMTYSSEETMRNVYATRKKH